MKRELNNYTNKVKRINEEGKMTHKVKYQKRIQKHTYLTKGVVRGTFGVEKNES